MTATTQHKTAYRPDIDGLRAIAVGIVVLFHAFPGWLPGGFVGVDVFFVISGYLISGILFSEMETGSYSIAQFYYRRFKRIFPALLLVMVACLVYGRFFLWPHQYLELAKEIASGAGFVANLLFWSQSGYFDPGADLKPMLHLWSLGIEEQFYLVWPLLLFLMKGVSRGRLRGVILVLMAASFVFSLYALKADQTGAFYSPIPRFWELLTGALIAALPRFAPETAMVWRHLASLLGLCLIAVATFLYSETSPFPGWLAVVPVAGSALVLLAGPSAILNRTALSSRIFVAVGLISYPLYLWHWPIFTFIRIAIEAPSARIMLAGTVLAVVLAALTFLLVERPLRRHDAGVLFKPVSFAMAAVLIFSLATVQFHIFMHPLTLKEKLLFPYDTAEIYRYKTCFLYPKTQSEADFAPECDPPAALHQKRVLIWGDSLAAQLYAGLNAWNMVQAGNALAIAQRTAGSCPPGMEIDRSENGHCDAINAATRAYIRDHRPDFVILNGRWWNNGRSLAERLPDIVSFLKDAGVKTVVVFGPAPDWWPDLRSLLMKLTLDEKVPERMALPPEAWTKTLEQDREIRVVTSALPVAYVSLVDQFCRGDQCLVRVNDDPIHGLITSDHDHLTEAASVFLFSQPAVADLFLQ